MNQDAIAATQGKIQLRNAVTQLIPLATALADNGILNDQAKIVVADYLTLQGAPAQNVALILAELYPATPA
jgi:hypothetical protein